MVGEIVMKPAWLQGLIAETFFAACGTHETRRKNEKNIFCLDCCLSICTHCLPSHRSHPLLQVRRYVYHDVVRMDDLEKLIDCSYVQPYTINNAKVVFLNPRPQSRPFRNSPSICFNCDRILQEPFQFCSISCKVDHVAMQGGDLSSILYRLDESDFAFSEFEGLRMDACSDKEDDGAQRFKDTTSCSTNNSRIVSSTQDSGMSKSKKKGKGKGDGFFPGLVLSLSRRKGAPQRSPLS